MSSYMAYMLCQIEILLLIFFRVRHTRFFSQLLFYINIEADKLVVGLLDHRPFYCIYIRVRPTRGLNARQCR